MEKSPGQTTRLAWLQNNSTGRNQPISSSTPDGQETPEQVACFTRIACSCSTAHNRKYLIEHFNKQRHKQKFYHDRRSAGELSTLYPGDQVRMEPLPGSRKWSAGVVISHHKNPRSYTVQAIMHTDATARSCASQLKQLTQKSSIVQNQHLKIMRHNLVSWLKQPLQIMFNVMNLGLVISCPTNRSSGRADRNNQCGNTCTSISWAVRKEERKDSPPSWKTGPVEPPSLWTLNHLNLFVLKTESFELICSWNCYSVIVFVFIVFPKRGDVMYFLSAVFPHPGCMLRTWSDMASWHYSTDSKMVRN